MSFNINNFKEKFDLVELLYNDEEQINSPKIIQLLMNNTDGNFTISFDYSNEIFYGSKYKFYVRTLGCLNSFSEISSIETAITGKFKLL